LGTPVGEPLGFPKALGGGGQQKGRPVFVLSGLDCLEIPSLGGAGNFPHVWAVVLSGGSGGFVILQTADRQVGGLQRFGVMGRPGYSRVFLAGATRRFSDSDIHSSSCGGVGHDGAAGTLKPLRIGSSLSQSVSAQRRRGGFWFREGAARVIVIGMWSEPVEGREASQLLIRGRKGGFAKARSMTEGRAFPTKRNLVYSPGQLRRANPASPAFSK